MALNTRYSVVDINSEKLLAWIWQHQRLKPGLATTGGESLKVIFPGRRNGLGGPDFRRAILTTHLGELRGDVELHLRTSLWRDHGHQRDPAYNTVVLHVVMWHDSPAPVCLNNGKQVPTLALAPYVLRHEKREKPSIREPCRQSERRLEPIALGQFLDLQGEARFMARVVCLTERLKHEDPAQVLYEGIMEALGYSRNQEAFKELARRLPLIDAEVVVKAGGWDAVYHLLLERGGLGDSSPTTLLPCREVRRERWEVGPPQHVCEKIRWLQQGVRPVNQPARRMLAFSHLLERYVNTGLLDGLMAVMGRAAQGGGQCELEAALLVDVKDEPVTADKCKRQPALLGQEWAGVIAVNILLPFACARGLESQALELYRGYKPLAENEITREMSELLDISKETVKSACRQQGLIHLFKLFCADRRCRECPLGGR